MSKPIKPDDITLAKTAAIPAVVFEVVNEMIVEKWNGSSATIYQNVLTKRIADRAPHVASKLFENHWLDFEDSYRAEGWTVDYDKPGYNENYEAYFKFSKPGKR